MNQLKMHNQTLIKPTVSKTLVHVLKKFSEKNGIDFPEICAAAGLDPAILTKGDRRIAAEQFLQIWDRAARECGDDNFGLHFGMELAKTYLQGNILVNMMANCATVGKAVQVFCKYHRLMEDAVLPKMAVSDHFVSIWWEFMIPEVKIPRQHAECLLCALTEILRTVSENQIDPKEVRFCHLPPDDIREHQTLFKCRMVFEQPKNLLKISRKDFDRPIFLSSRAMFDVLEPLAEKHLHEMYFSASFPERVCREIRLLMSRGETPDIETVSKNLGMSPRSLQMKLQKENTTFKKLLDRLRKGTALAYLKDPEASICDVALLLGFSEQSAFNHAFKRWTGTSPGKYMRGGLPKEK